MTSLFKTAGWTFLMVLAHCLAGAQSLSVTVPTLTALPGQAVYVPVKLSGAGSTGVPISGANIQITFDTAVVRYDTLTNFYSSMPQSQWFFAGNNGLVSANWLEPSLLTLAVPDNTTLYEIKFTKKTAGNTPLTFIVNEFTDAAYNVIPTTPVNGAINAPAIFRQVTFKVDMSKETLSPNGIHLAGSFNNWSYSQAPMTLTPGTSIYTATVSLQEGTTIRYRFVNGNTAAGQETVPPGCGVINTSGQYERQMIIPASDTTLSPVCFSRCGPCPVSMNLTLRVDMQNQPVAPEGVQVAGTFNNWNYSQQPMVNTGGSVYETTLILDEGTYLEYRFVNGITSAGAETVPAQCAVNGNRFLTTPAQDTLIGTVCFDSCLACGSVPQYSQVTFRVNMRTQPVIAPEGVHIAGTFQGWNPASTPMIHAGDSVYSFTASLLAGTTAEYRFVNGNNAAAYEIVPFSCAQNGNRALLIPAHDTVLRVICFSSCDTCVITGTETTPETYERLIQNRPNPCAESTLIGFYMPEAGFARITLFAIPGNRYETLSEGVFPAGLHELSVDCTRYTSGVYGYRLEQQFGGSVFILNKKMIIR